VRIAEHCGRECRLQGRLDVNNPGTALAAASIVRFYLSNDETLDGSDILIEQTKLDPLGPGETVRVKLRAEVPTGTAKGRFVIAVLDATDVVPEINEANNIVVSEVIQ
jgi:predicted thioesterase